MAQDETLWRVRRRRRRSRWWRFVGVIESNSSWLFVIVAVFVGVLVGALTPFLLPHLAPFLRLR